MGWEWGSLYSSAQRPSLALCLEDLTWVGVRKPFPPPRSFQSPLSTLSLCYALWRHLLEKHGLPSTFSPSQPWGPAWRW